MRYKDYIVLLLIMSSKKIKTVKQEPKELVTNNEKTKELVIKNEKIINFYNKNKQLDFEKINLLYVELFENVMSASFDNPSIVNHIMMSINNQNNELNNVMSLLKSSSENYKSELQNLKDVNILSINNIKSEIDQIKTSISSLNNLLMSKLYETKEQYINEIKEILKNSENKSILSLSSTIEKQNNMLTEKIILNINDIIPKSQTKQCDDIVNLFKKDFLSSLNEIKENDPTSIIDKLSSTIENKYNLLFNSLHENMINNISQSELRLSSNLNQLKEISTKNSIIQESINEELIKYINKSKTISGKGSQSENILFNLLTKEYTSAEVIDTSGSVSKGDAIIKRKDKIPILIETKNYTSNVKKEEIDKFIRDVTNNDCSGVFLSQNSGIVGKDNFQIDIHNKNILIFIHCVNYDITKINLAINTIDVLYDKLIKINEKNINMPTDTLKEINTEYQTFIYQKEKMVNGLKEYYKKTFDQYCDLTLPSLEKFISGYYANVKKNLITCELCKTFETDNLRSMARHKQFCKKKENKNNNLIEEFDIKNNNDIINDNLSDSYENKNIKNNDFTDNNIDDIINSLENCDDETKKNIMDQIEEFNKSISEEDNNKKLKKNKKTHKTKNKEIDV